MSLECLHSSVGEEFKRFLREDLQKCPLYRLAAVLWF
jgi:hypothetical protein